MFANALHYMAGQGAMAVFGLVSSIVLARYLPKDVFGQYFYFLDAGDPVPADPGCGRPYALRRARRARPLAHRRVVVARDRGEASTRCRSWRC